jgi:hypothetical protein
MTTIHVTIESQLQPGQVLAAGYDFRPRRAEIFPAVSTEHMEVHQLGETAADVTEGTPAGIGINWERCRYDWSTPRSVIATVTDSNVYQPGSSWELRAAPSAVGSSVEMIWIRNFTHDARGRIFGALFRIVGKPIFMRDAKRILRNLERVESNTARHDTPAPG